MHRVKVTPELLATLLQLPVEARVVGISMNQEVVPLVIDLQIEGLNRPEPEGAEIEVILRSFQHPIIGWSDLQLTETKVEGWHVESDS